jgi:hypothetical protein
MRLIQARQLWRLRPRSDRHEQADRDAKTAVRQLLDTHNFGEVLGLHRVAGEGKRIVMNSRMPAG